MNDNAWTTTTTLVFNWATANTNTSFTYSFKEDATMIDSPAFIQIDLLNNTRITGRFARYSDPKGAATYSAFVGEGADGSVHYVLWAAILSVTVFPLTAENPTTPASPFAL